MEVIIDNAESKTTSSDKSGSVTEQTSSLPIPASDGNRSAETHGTSTEAAAPSCTDVEPSKPTTSVSVNEYDAPNVLVDLPQAELRLLCSLLAREGYVCSFVS